MVVLNSFPFIVEDTFLCNWPAATMTPTACASNHAAKIRQTAYPRLSRLCMTNMDYQDVCKHPTCQQMTLAAARRLPDCNSAS